MVFISGGPYIQGGGGVFTAGFDCTLKFDVLLLYLLRAQHMRVRD